MPAASPAPPDGPPPAAAEVFGAALPRAVAYATALAGPAIERGLLGPAEAGRVWERHLLNCAPVAGLVPSAATVLDAGSGAGLPGIVLALLRPDVALLALDAQARRCAFLEEMVDALDLAGTVTVRQGRVEDLPATERYDCITMRAFAPLARIVPWAVPRLTARGRVLAIKGRAAEVEVAAARAALRRANAGAQVRRCALPAPHPATTVVEVARVRQAAKEHR